MVSSHRTIWDISLRSLLLDVEPAGRDLCLVQNCSRCVHLWFLLVECNADRRIWYPSTVVALEIWTTHARTPLRESSRKSATGFTNPGGVDHGTAGIDSYLIMRVTCSCSPRAFYVFDVYLSRSPSASATSFRLRVIRHQELDDQPVHYGTTRRDFRVRLSFLSRWAFSSPETRITRATLSANNGSSPRSVNSYLLRIRILDATNPDVHPRDD